ncbi:MAG: helix-turn-helix transcriptional regulator [Gemmatimonadaceae bacterium]|nr:helix-turn-helix transcriptional regulator [Gemmatimonadaceae bacterium]
MSISRQVTRAVPIVRTMSIGFSSGYEWQQHALDWGVVVWASRGVITVAIDSRVWVISPAQGLWVPPRVAHAVRMSGRGTLRQVYVAARATRRLARMPSVIAVTPLLREILRRMCAMGTLDRQRPAEHRLFTLLVDEVAAVAAPEAAFASARPPELPMPRDPRARRAARAARRDVGLARRPDALAREAHASVRTLERLFAGETGMSFGAWRRRAVMIAAMSRLADGASVTEVALETGYASSSAFVAAFRRAVGVPPGRYAATTREVRR